MRQADSFPVTQLLMVAYRFRPTRVGDLGLSHDLGSGARKVTHDYMHESQFEAWLTAKKQLHFNPGVNPHNGVTTSVLWEVRVSTFDKVSSYWHTTPGLYDAFGANGAEIFLLYDSQIKWQHPDLIEEIEAEQRYQDEQESSQ